jgi:hypothetical protein
MRSRVFLVLFATLLLGGESAASSIPEMRLGSALSVNGSVFLIQGNPGVGVWAWYWNSDEGGYAPANWSAADDVRQIELLATAPLSDGSAILLGNVRGVGQAVWQIRSSGSSDLSLERLTAYARRLEEMDIVHPFEGGTFIVSGPLVAGLIGKTSACTWNIGERPADQRSFATAVQRREVMIVNGGLRQFVVADQRCPVRPAVFWPERRAVGVVAFREGWLILMNNRMGGRSLIAFDRRLRPLWMFRLLPKGWLLDRVGDRAVVWSPGETTAYEISAESVSELVVPNTREPIDLVHGAVGAIAFATPEGIVTATRKRDRARARAFRVPLTLMIMSIGEAAAVAAFVTLVMIVVIVFARRRMVTRGG